MTVIPYSRTNWQFRYIPSIVFFAKIINERPFEVRRDYTKAGPRETVLCHLFASIAANTVLYDSSDVLWFCISWKMLAKYEETEVENDSSVYTKRIKPKKSTTSALSLLFYSLFCRNYSDFLNNKSKNEWRRLHKA